MKKITIHIQYPFLFTISVVTVTLTNSLVLTQFKKRNPIPYSLFPIPNSNFPHPISNFSIPFAYPYPYPIHIAHTHTHKNRSRSHLISSSLKCKIMHIHTSSLITNNPPGKKQVCRHRHRHLPFQTDRQADLRSLAAS